MIAPLGRQRRYATFLGGSGFDEIRGIAVVDDKNVYFVGRSNSPNFPSTARGSCYTQVGLDVVIGKLDTTLADNKGLIDGRYIGGNGDDSGIAIALDRQQILYVTGQTASSNFPTLGASQPLYAGNNDAFALKLNLTKPDPDVPNLSAYLEDDLFTPAEKVIYTTGTNPAIELNLSIARYYGPVSFSTGQLQNANNPDSILHAPVVVLNLWVKPGSVNTTSQPLTITITGGPANLTSSFTYTLKGVASVSQMITIPIPVANLFFPNICTAERVVSSCLRDPMRLNYPATAPDNENSFVSISKLATLNKIKITGWQDGSVISRLACNPYLFLNGVRPVLFASGFAPGFSSLTAGNAYITGQSTSTAGFFDGCVNEPDPLPKEDAFIIKINAFGNSVPYRYCLRGNGGDIGFDIAVDSSGSAYIAGSTGSNDLYTITGVSAGLPIQNGQNEAFGQQGFVLKLNPIGSTPTNFTYLGGNGDDAIFALALDAARTVYVTGSTKSSNFPVKNAAQASLRGSEDSFVARLLMPGNSTVMAYSTFLGGTQEDYSFGLAVDSAGNAYTTGLTYSTDFVTTAGAVQTTLAGGSGDADAFAVKLDRVGNQILYSTYLGSTLPDEARDIAVDTNGVIYLTGATFGAFPIANNTNCLKLPPVVTGVFNLFFSKINPALANSQGLLYSVSLGGSGDDLAIGLTLDQNNNAYVVGSVQEGFPTSSNYDTTYNGGPYDGIVIKFAANTGDPDVPKLNEEELDDLYSLPQIVQKSLGASPTLEIDLPIRRYYGLVNPTSFKLIEYDPPAGTTPEAIGRNQRVHAPNAELSLWFKPGTAVNTPQQLTVEITGPNNQSSSFQVTVPGIAAVGQPLTITIPTSKLFFPDICPGRTTANCLRDPGKKNYPDETNSTTEGASSFQSLKPVYNKIKITGWSSGNVIDRLSCGPTLFLNGVRPVVFASGFGYLTDNSSGAQFGRGDNTNDWGATTSIGDQPQIPPGMPTNYSINNWIRWLGNYGIASWNPGWRGSDSFADQEKYLLEGTQFLNRVYGIKRVNLIAVSLGGVPARLFAYNSNILKKNAGFSVDKLATLGSPHTGVPISIGNPSFVLGGSAGIQVSIREMFKFNQRYSNLKNAWGSESSKDHLFLAAVQGKRNFCVTDCSRYVGEDGTIETVSALGTGYPPSSVADQASLPSFYSTYITDSNLLNSCDRVMGVNLIDNTCHRWLPHSPQLANWITNTSGLANYGKNQLLSPQFSSVDEKEKLGLEYNSSLNKDRENEKNSGGSGNSGSIDQYPLNNWGATAYRSSISNYSNRSVVGEFFRLAFGVSSYRGSYSDAGSSRDSLVFYNEEEFVRSSQNNVYFGRDSNNSTAVQSNPLVYTSIGHSSGWAYSLPMARLVFINRNDTASRGGRGRIKQDAASLQLGSNLSTSNNSTVFSSFNNMSLTAANNPTQTLLAGIGNLPANTVITLPVKIDNVSDVQMQLGASGNAELQARLETAAGSPVITNHVTPVTLVFSDTVLTPGTYNLILTSGTVTGTAQYGVLVEARSDLIIVPSLTPTTVGSATPGKLSARLVISSTAQAVTGSTVTATLVAAPSTGTGTPVTTTLTLLDNGTDGDQTASDGIYTALLPAGLTSEVLQAEVFASGTYGGNAFTRYEVRLDRARSGELTFTGPYSWQTASGFTLGASTDINTLSFNAGVNVQQAATYRVEATLVGADGTSVSNASATLALGAGPNTVKLDFNGLQVWEQQVSGSYRISYLNAFKEAETASGSSYPTDLIADTSTLPVLNITRSQLHRPSFLLSGAVAETSLLPDSSGKPGVLRVNIPLDVAFAKTYSYSAILRTQNGSLVTWTQGKAALVAGVNNTLSLNFKGNEIFAAGTGGPYTVETLIIKDASTSEVLFYLPKVKETVNYQANSFSPCGLFNVTSELDGAVSGSCQLTLRQAIVNADELGDRLITFTLRPNAQITLNSPLVLSVGLALEADCANRVTLVASFANMVQLDGTNRLKGLLVRSSTGPILKLNGTGNTIECTSVRVGTGP